MIVAPATLRPALYEVEEAQFLQILVGEIVGVYALQNLLLPYRAHLVVLTLTVESYHPRISAIVYIARVGAHIAQHRHRILSHGIAQRRGFIALQLVAMERQTVKILPCEHTAQFVFKFHFLP